MYRAIDESSLTKAQKQGAEKLPFFDRPPKPKKAKAAPADKPKKARAKKAAPADKPKKARAKAKAEAAPADKPKKARAKKAAPAGPRKLRTAKFVLGQLDGFNRGHAERWGDGKIRMSKELLKVLQTTDIYNLNYALIATGRTKDGKGTIATVRDWNMSYLFEPWEDMSMDG